MKPASRFCTLLIAGAMAAASPARAETTLNYGSPLQSNHPFGEATQSWLEGLTKASGGDLKFQVYTGGTVAKFKESLSSIKNGLVDVGFVVPAYIPSELPHQVMAGRNGGLGEDSMVISGALNELILLHCDECSKDWAKNGAISMAFVATEPIKLVCRDQLDTAAKIAGKRVRAAGSTGIVAKEMGAVPVNIPITDTYEALSRGQVDCTMASEGQLTSYSFNEVAKFVIDIPISVYGGNSLFVINKDKWSALSSTQKGLIQAGMGQLVSDALQRSREVDIRAKKDALAKGIVWVEPDKSLIEARDRYRAELPGLAIADAKKRGAKGVEALMTAFPPIHEKWKKIVAETGHDRAKFTEALNREVFSKVKY